LVAVAVRGVLSLSTVTVTRFQDRCEFSIPESEFGSGISGSLPCNPERVTEVAGWRGPIMAAVVVSIVIGAALVWLMVPRLAARSQKLDSVRPIGGTELAGFTSPTSQPRWARWLVGGIAVVFYAATLALLCLHVGLVLFEEGDFGDAPLSDRATVVWSIVITVGAGFVLPWVWRHDPRSGWSETGSAHRATEVRHMVVAVVAMVSMLGYMVVIDTAGGRRERLSIAIPVICLPVAMLMAWRATRPPSGAIVHPPRDIVGPN
jgi:hypothetical protein